MSAVVKCYESADPTNVALFGKHAHSSDPHSLTHDTNQARRAWEVGGGVI
jgi:hypothetical protein